MVEKTFYFVGVDPGQSGGLGVLDLQGRCIGSHRWRRVNPKKLFDILSLIRDSLINIYIESISVFPQKQVGFIFQGQGLLVNSGIWQGWALVLDLPLVVVHPAIWQKAHGLTKWQSNLKAGGWGPSPLSRAREYWPSAGLDFQADDGRAVGLLLADLSRRDYLAGIDRGGAQAQKEEKRKLAKKRKRQITKLKEGAGLWPKEELS